MATRKPLVLTSGGLQELPAGDTISAADAPGTVLLASSGTPAALGTAARGTGSTAARDDHVHAHGNQSGGSLHADATTSVSGFMSGSDKTKLNGVATGATANSGEATTATANTLVKRNANGDVVANQLYGASGLSTGGYWYMNGAGTAYMAWAASVIYGSHAMVAPSFTPSSDLRLKTDIVPVDPEDARRRVLAEQHIEWTSLQDGVRRRGYGAQYERRHDPLSVVGGGRGAQRKNPLTGEKIPRYLALDVTAKVADHGAVLKLLLAEVAEMRAELATLRGDPTIITPLLPAPTGE